MASIKDDLGAYLREQRQSAKLTLRQLAELAEVSNPYLSQIERGLKKPSAEILQSLAKGLRVSAESLYVKAGILEERDDEQVGVEAAILGDHVLNERQKRVLLEIYETFRAEGARAADEQGAAPAAPSAGASSKPTASRRAATTARKSAKKTAARTAKKTAARTAKKTAARTAKKATGAAAPTAVRTTARKSAPKGAAGSAAKAAEPIRSTTRTTTQRSSS